MKIIESKCKDIFILYKKLRKKYKNTSILESLGDANWDTCRYSIMGVIASEKMCGNYNDVYIEDLNNNEKRKVNWLDELDKWTKSQKYINLPIQLGAIGYIGYENKFVFETLNNTIIKDHKVPDICLIRYKLLLVEEKNTKLKYWICEDDIDEGLCLELDKLENLEYLDFLDSNSCGVKSYDNFLIKGKIKKDFTKEKYIDSIIKTIEYIRNGDIFQANITMRFRGNYSGDVFELYIHLREVTPNPFFAFFDFEFPLISTSPERFVSIRGRDIYTYPIKGTMRIRMGGRDTSRMLENSEKNRAENVMIVDLMRNDLGRVCEIGSIKVPYLCRVKKFNLVYHLESLICGKLKDSVSFSQILKGVFPGGSITGAPKIRAMDIIEELEFTKRGPYCGLIGFFGTNGWIDTSIAIRILYFDEGEFFYHAGGGIVADSIPQSEYNELLLKLEAIRKGLDNFIMK